MKQFTEICLLSWKKYEQKGIDISIDGYRASPLQIVTAYMTKEEGTYMRDYVLSRDGISKRLSLRISMILNRREIPLNRRTDEKQSVFRKNV